MAGNGALIDGPNNRYAFTAGVGQCLAPILAPDDIVIADSPGSHKGQPARQLIRNAAAHLRFLPPYSPDLTRLTAIACNRLPANGSSWSSPGLKSFVGKTINRIAFCSCSCSCSLREASEPCSTHSARRNAQITAAMHDTSPSNSDTLKWHRPPWCDFGSARNRLPFALEK